MSLRKILLHPDPFLRRVSLPVDKFDEELRTLVRDMAETMYAAPGVGLAAVQVGAAVRLFVIDVKEADPTGTPRLLVFANPEILEKQGEVLWEEGCLSLPEMTEEVVRAERIAVRAQDENGRSFELEADGLLAVAIQHEYDHLDGVLLFDRLSPLKRKFALRKYLKHLKSKDEKHAEHGAVL